MVLSKRPIVYTLGHSNRSWKDFAQILADYHIDQLIDVRSHPGSKKFPWFNRQAMARKLKGGYMWLPELGGPVSGVYGDPKVFPKQHVAKTNYARIPKEKRPVVWWNVGLRDYQKWMAKDPRFQDGIFRLLELAHTHQKVAIFCAEVLYWKCHRQMIADAWVLAGCRMVHILPPRGLLEHVLADRIARYDPKVRQFLRKLARLVKKQVEQTGV